MSLLQGQQAASQISHNGATTINRQEPPQQGPPAQQPPSTPQPGFPPFQQQLYPGQQAPYPPSANPQFQQQLQPGQQSPYPPPSPTNPQFQQQLQPPQQMSSHPPSPSLQPLQQPPGFDVGMMPSQMGMPGLGTPSHPQYGGFGGFPQQGQPQWQQPPVQMWGQPQSRQPDIGPNTSHPQFYNQGQWPGQHYPSQMMGINTPQPVWQPQTGGYIPPPHIGSTDPSTASLGYTEVLQDSNIYTPQAAAEDMEIIVKAFKSTNTDEKALISVLTGRNIHPLHLASIRQAYRNAQSNIPGKEIVDVANNKKLNFGDGFKHAVTAILYGPLQLDAYLLNRAIDGVGTVEKILDLVLLGRKNADIVAIKNEYAKMYRKDLTKSVKGDLSRDILELFLTALEARREYEDENTIRAMGSENWQRLVQADCKELYTAMVGAAEGNRVSNIFVTRSDLRLRAIAENYTSYTASGDSLEHMVKKKFRGHMEDALLYILHGAMDRAKRDASLLSESFSAANFGKFDREEQLAIRIVKLAWEDCANPGYMVEVKKAYLKHFARADGKGKVKLVSEVKEKTRGDFQKLLLKLLKEDQHNGEGF